MPATPDGHGGNIHYAPKLNYLVILTYIVIGLSLDLFSTAAIDAQLVTHTNRIIEAVKPYIPDTFFGLEIDAPRNFILKNDGSLVLIDWEFAGWWAEYWKYTKCHFAVFREHRGWLELIEDNIPIYRAELETDRTCWEYTEKQ